MPKSNTGKINGVSLVSPPLFTDQVNFDPIVAINSEWVAIIPYAFSRKNEPQVYFNWERQWWGERTEGVIQLTEMAKSNNLSVMLKPHVWVRGDGWPGDFQLATDKEWKIWEQDYEQYILHFARLADSLNIELFCIGTEFRKAVVQRPIFWEELIRKVRKVYSGKLTYAENWDNYENVSFWDQLDFIGIDAYFPVDTAAKPSLVQLQSGWQIQAKKLAQFSKKYDKQILFTEYGYQSQPGTAGNHWELNQSAVCLSCQSTAYEAIFTVFWRQDWFAGGFFWKWHFHEGIGGENDADFTPQGKPALNVISNYYEQYKSIK
jgi:hypothetical protein